MSRSVFYCRCGARLEGSAARLAHRCPATRTPAQLCRMAADQYEQSAQRYRDERRESPTAIEHQKLADEFRQLATAFEEPGPPVAGETPQAVVTQADAKRLRDNAEDAPASEAAFMRDLASRIERAPSARETEDVIGPPYPPTPPRAGAARRYCADCGVALPPGPHDDGCKSAPARAPEAATGETVEWTAWTEDGDRSPAAALALLAHFAGGPSETLTAQRWVRDAADVLRAALRAPAGEREALDVSKLTVMDVNDRLLDATDVLHHFNAAPASRANTETTVAELRRLLLPILAATPGARPSGEERVSLADGGWGCARSECETPDGCHFASECLGKRPSGEAKP